MERGANETINSEDRLKGFYNRDKLFKIKKFIYDN